MATDSQGSNFTFAGSTYTVTSVTVTPGGDLLDTSHLGLASGANRTYQAPALKDNEISCEAYGTTALSIGTSGTLSFATVSYTATVSSSSVAYAVGELVKQSLTFKVAP
ncbi:MAG: hypothetical protein EBT03_12560 [Betaproteobacteria bacterium]|nr:hypothetical protein [Betaproteobacteria bacterium]